MLFDLKGHLNNLNLPASKALWPLFEAVVNSIQAIEELPNRDYGRITIYAERDQYVQSEMGKEESLGRFCSFTINDNGVGFDEENFKSFHTACSTLKIKKGCKGIGRFLWLKSFAEVEIASIYNEQDQMFKREFTFTAEKGISPEDSVPSVTDCIQNETTVKLKGLFAKYKDALPVELEGIGKRIVEHCLPFFISEQCPEIILSDGISDPINLNAYFKDNVKDSLHQDHFEVDDNQFIIYHLRLPEGTDTHRLHLCANMQEVESVELKSVIPNLHKKLYPNDDPVGFYYVGYVTSAYLDSVVNPTRTGFDFDESEDNAQISMFGTGKAAVVNASLAFIKAYLAEDLSEVEKKKHEQIDDFVAYNRPAYRYLLHLRPDVYDRIPAGLKPAELELELHKSFQEWESDVFKQGKELEIASNSKSRDDRALDDLFNKYWQGVTELSKTCLAEYVTRRKAILHLLEDALTIQDNGRFKKEEVIHSIICPMRHTSDDVSFEEMNLWIVDERLAYHRFLASDKTIKSLPAVNSLSTKELDIAVFDRAFAYSEDVDPLNTITIIEFKKPDNKKDDPISQMGKYIDEIVSGKKKRSSGLAFGDCSKTCFRCYAICDLTPKMVANCKTAGLRLAPDGMGFYGYQPERNAYVEVISYQKLLSDAKKRNQILFDKLFSPKANEVIHIPNT